MGKSKNVLISIIVPLYNEEQNILKLIKNISKQTFKSFEVVFIDDGSLDNTAELINKNAGKYFRYQYYWKNNGGVGSARNFGIQISEGKYITFLDADDYYDETFLEKMFKKICLENTNFCFCGYNLNTQNGIKRIKTVFPKENLLQLYWLGKLKVHTDSWIIDKTFLLKNEIFFRNDKLGRRFLFF
ncbi:glycosyltransferase [Enterococcus gallinarum]|nr:glycosyltransferase [Enterococcus gallinarum]